MRTKAPEATPTLRELPRERAVIVDIFGESPSRLSWTTLGPALEFALRRAFSQLELVTLAEIDAPFRFVVGPATDGRLAIEEIDGAVTFAAGRRLGVRLRVIRVRKAAREWSVADPALARALRAGREQADIATRSSNDLITTLGRLRELLFRVWSHHLSAGIATLTDAGTISTGAVLEVIAAVGELSLEQGRPLSVRGSAKEPVATKHASRPIGDALRVTASELGILAAELGRRWNDKGLLANSADVTELGWSDLANVATGLIDRDAVRAIVARPQ